MGMTRPTFAELLHHHRVARGLTRAQLARQAGLNEDTVGDLERAAKRPRPATVEVLARALELTADQLEAFRVAAAGGVGATAEGPAAGSPRPRGELRRGASSFVGREEEMAGVRRRLAGHRLVTLTGPGGVGKTRLAVEVAHGLAEADSEASAIPDGVWLAELAPLADPDLVPRVVAAAVGVEPDPDGPPVDALADALRDRRLLLVLDNCEHLVDACAALAEALLGACPHLRLLATSREPLGCDGEAVVRVPSLALPPAGGAASFAEIGGAAAVRLFVDRAAEVAPAFALTARNALAVAEVCRRLDGIPLALEFAARLVRALPVEEVAARLDDRFRLLTGGRRTALGRQQTLRALVDWSYDLLDPGERALFVRLSVFVSAFTLDAAQAVCGGPDAEDAEGRADVWPAAHVAHVLAPLLRLVDTSFVLTEGGADQEGTGGAARYRLLETLREYGRERLVADPVGAARLRDRHLAYHLGLVDEAAASSGARQTDALRRLDAARDDLWAALSWAREQEDATADRRLAGALARLVDRLAVPDVRRALAPLLFETRRLGLSAYAAAERRLLEHTEPAVLSAGADLYWVIGDWPAEEAVAGRMEEVGTTGGKGEQAAPAAARAQLRTARVLVLRNGLREALRLLDGIVRTAEARGDDALLLDARLERGYAHCHTGDCAAGRRAYAEAVVLLEHLRPRLGDAAYRTKRLLALRGSGFVEHNADDNAACAALHGQAVGLARELRDGPEVARELVNLADAWWGCWEYALALRTYAEALAAATADSYARGRAASVLGRGIVLGSIGRYEEAVPLLAEGLDVFRGLGDVWFISYGLAHLSAVRAGQGDLDAALEASREATTVAGAAGLGYTLALARAHLLWQEESRAPGNADHAPRIEAALADARRLGLRGPAVHLAWVRLLHRAADATLPDGVLESELADTLSAAPPHPPVKGSWELLGRRVAGTLQVRRPGVDRSGLEALVEHVVRTKERSLDPEDRLQFRATRRGCDDRGAAIPDRAAGVWDARARR
jgi:predicted ATPase/transcriptional regulator with XRE-family HTH domain